MAAVQPVWSAIWPSLCLHYSHTDYSLYCRFSDAYHSSRIPIAGEGGHNNLCEVVIPCNFKMSQNGNAGRDAQSRRIVKPRATLHLSSLSLVTSLHSSWIIFPDIVLTIFPLSHSCPNQIPGRRALDISHGQPLLQILQRHQQFLWSRSSRRIGSSNPILSSCPTEDYIELARQATGRRC